jgi:hypothetical protein
LWQVGAIAQSPSHHGSGFFADQTFIDPHQHAAAANKIELNQLAHADSAAVTLPLTVQPPLRILGIAASPRGLQQLDVEKEQENLARALRRPIDAGQIELQWAPRATWSDLQDLLQDDSQVWHVVHFLGHGDFDLDSDTGLLVLVGQDGRQHRVPATQFVTLLKQARSMPRMAVLNSCSGAAAGQLDLFAGTAAALIRGGVAAAAAMQYPITDAAAIAFSRGFYTAIANNRGVDEAVSSGRAAIVGLNPGTLEWVTPVMYLRGEQTQYSPWRRFRPRRCRVQRSRRRRSRRRPGGKGSSWLA